MVIGVVVEARADGSPVPRGLCMSVVSFGAAKITACLLELCGSVRDDHCRCQPGGALCEHVLTPERNDGSQRQQAEEGAVRFFIYSDIVLSRIGVRVRVCMWR